MMAVEEVVADLLIFFIIFYFEVIISLGEEMVNCEIELELRKRKTTEEEAASLSVYFMFLVDYLK